MLSKIVKQEVYPECPPTYPSIIFFSLSDSNNYPLHTQTLAFSCLSKPLLAFHCPSPHGTPPSQTSLQNVSGSGTTNIYQP